MTFQNKSEEFIYSVTHRSFLSLWSYANPIKDDGKELCDILVVFGSNVAIFSVKESNLLSESPIDIERWIRRAINGSTKQIYGAEKSLHSATHIVQSNGLQGFPLPSRFEMQVHRIAISLGSQGKAPIASQDYGKGFVHVFDEDAFSSIMGELDTAPDFFEYLSKKLIFLSKPSLVQLEGGEEDLLAIYLANNRSFPIATGVISIGSGIWDNFKQQPQYFAKKEADKISVVWDNLIEYVARDALDGTLEFGSTLSNTELALRQMTAENRYQRRLLAQAFDEFLQQSSKRIRSRLVISGSGTIYVFLAKPLGTKREKRSEELLARCFIARGKLRDHTTVVGIATEEYVPNQGFSLDLLYVCKPEWTEEDQKTFDEVEQKLSYFTGSLEQRFNEDEYPS